MSAAQARVEFNPLAFGLRFAIRRDDGDLLSYGPAQITRVAEGEQGYEHDAWTQIPEEEARALYEALAQYFGRRASACRQVDRRRDREGTRMSAAWLDAYTKFAQQNPEPLDDEIAVFKAGYVAALNDLATYFGDMVTPAGEADDRLMFDVAEAIRARVAEASA